MIENKTIAVVIPAFNEEKQIGFVIETIPEFVDRIIVVNDCSTDNTKTVAESYFDKTGFSKLPEKKKETFIHERYRRADKIMNEISQREITFFPNFEIIHPSADNRLVVMSLKKNSGVGAAVSVGYKWAKDHQIDCTVSMDGDGQMDPSELKNLCLPIINEEADWTKGNRFAHSSAPFLIPRKRFLGNAILSILTKIASGYWEVSDTQTGFTALSHKALSSIKLYNLYKRYGMPNDRIIKLNIAGCTLKEVPIKPVYDIGEKSTMRIRKVIRPISWLLLRSFFKRIWTRYLYKSFHPLFILYHFSFILLLLSIPYGIKILWYVFEGLKSNPVTVMAFVFLFISGFQSLLFAMWMDMQDNKRLYKD